MIDLNNHFTSFKSIICLNGEIPSKHLFIRYQKLPLIAADGAANKLLSMDLLPVLIVGDLDSIDIKNIPKHIEIVHISSQTTTDLEKCLDTALERNLLPCLIYGATGQETDHMLYTLNVIEQYSLQHKITFHDSAYRDKEKYGIFISDYLCGNLKAKSKISFFSSTKACLSSKGLVWELENMELSTSVCSARNAIRDGKFEITVHEGNVLVLFDYEKVA